MSDDKLNKGTGDIMQARTYQHKSYFDSYDILHSVMGQGQATGSSSSAFYRLQTI